MSNHPSASDTTASRVESPLWTVGDVAAYLRVPPKTLYEWRAKNYGPQGNKVGKHLRYDPEVVREWFRAQNAA